MNENPALKLEKEEDYERRVRNEDYDDYDDWIRANRSEDINIDEYLSNDETPDYKTQTSNYSDDDDDRETPFAAPVSFTRFNQSVKYFYLDESEIAEFCWVLTIWVISVVAYQIW
jgi:RNA polymerase sigma-54 factor